ncbi:MAG TPA: hypothetical protein VFO68_33245 [Actinophytocola sp.]|nr:hypothetical protein [Actinophytocola sp.]
MSLVRTRIVIVLLAAMAVTAFGITRLFAETGATEVTRVGTLDGLSAEVTTAGWVEMDHDMSGNAPGYQMPPAMMPGMPDQGDQRIAVKLTVANTTAGTRQLRAGEEFTLHSAKDGKSWTPHSHTFGELPRLAGRNVISGVLYFDLPPADVADSATWIEWSHGDGSTRLFVPLNGAEPGHQHNP